MIVLLASFNDGDISFFKKTIICILLNALLYCVSSAFHFFTSSIDMLFFALYFTTL